MSTPAGDSASFRCSIVIPVFNRAALTARCLETLFAGPDEEQSFEVIVVDDGSSDGTQALLGRFAARIRVVRHDVNAGFAVSCNDGARAAQGEFLVFLNNDTIPEPGWLDALVRYADAHPRAAVVGAKLLFPDGSVQHAGVVICQDGCPRHVYAGFAGDHPAVNKSRRYQIVTAACALVRRRAFEEAGGFDISFVNGYEDADLCLRLQELGYEIHYCHQSVVSHLESVTRGNEGWTYGLSLYRQRWIDRVIPDDLRYYAEDGLMRFEYDAIYPFRILASPELTVVRQPTTQIDDLLDRRAFERQTLLKENIRLTAELLAREAERAGPGPAETSAGEVDPAGPLAILRHETHALAGYEGARLVSLILLVQDGARPLDEVAARIRVQNAPCRVELLALDQAGLTRARARNLAAESAQGDPCVFLEEDALPADDHWLASLLDALDADERLAAVTSRVLPRADARPLTRLDAERAPGGSEESRVHEIADPRELTTLDVEVLRGLLEFPTIGTAIRARALSAIPFPEAHAPASDLAWSRGVLAAGYRLRYEPASRVVKSRERTFFELLEQNVDLGAAEREILGRSFAASQIVSGIFTLARQDWESLEQLGLSEEELEHERLVAVLRRTAELVGQWIGINVPGASGRLLPALEELAHRATDRAEGEPLPPGV